MSQPRFAHFPQSLKYALEGVAHAFRYHLSLQIEVLVGALVVFFGFYFRITRFEWAILVLTIGLVLAAELFNTAVEATLDYMTKKHHLSVKLAKDVAAGAVFVLAVFSLILGMIIFAPYVRVLLG